MMPRTRCHPFVVNSSLDFRDADGRSELIPDLCNEVLNPELTTNMGRRAVLDSPMLSMELKNTPFEVIDSAIGRIVSRQWLWW
jgi:hypothetical protein